MPSLIVQFLLWILVGAFAGWLTGKNMKGYGYGPLIDVPMGAVGAVAAALTFGATGTLGQWGLLVTLPAAALGAILLTGFISFSSGERRHA